MKPQNVIRILIALNVLVFLAWSFPSLGIFTPEYMIDNFLVSYDRLEEGRYWTLLTSVFSHNMLLHLVINMFVLNSFGPVVVFTLGTARFLKFYISAGIVASIGHALVSAFIIGNPEIPALGASGAIAGMVLLFSLLYPKQKILLFAIIPMPAVVGALAFVALDIWGVIAQRGGGGLPIGHGAHLGGALAGFIYYLVIRTKFRRSENEPR